VFNKIDLMGNLKPGFLEPSEQSEVIPISALTGEGFDQLTKEIFTRLSGDKGAERDDVMITDARQHAAVKKSLEQLSSARDLMIEGELEEIVLLKLHGALQSLGEVTGETLTDDILGQIFSTFCIGK
jgi:tRNA modification GTPase